MYTNFDKAIVAFIMALIAILNVFFPGKFGIDAATVTSVVAILTPLLVYLIPNLPKDTA
jgi:hypothetical protein